MRRPEYSRPAHGPPGPADHDRGHRRRREDDPGRAARHGAAGRAAAARAVALSERVRDLVKDPALHVDARAEALLYAAARAQLVHERLLPLLESGTDVLLDRFVDSSLAYQGAGRGLGVREIAELNSFGTAGLVPDRTLYLRVPPSVGAARRGGEDRLEREPEAFFAAIVAEYDAIARDEPGRVRVIDATRPPDDVLADALQAVADLR
jgi:dTMP kinase